MTGVDVFVAVPHADDRAKLTWMLGKAGAIACPIKSWPQLSKCGEIVERLITPQDVVLIALEPQPLVALAFATWLRDRSFQPPIVALAGPNTQIDPRLVARAGGDEVVPFPSNAKDLVRALLPHVRSSVADDFGAAKLAAHSREPAFMFELSEQLERHFCGGCPLADVCAPGQTLRNDQACPAAAFVRGVFEKVAGRVRIDDAGSTVGGPTSRRAERSVDAPVGPRQLVRRPPIG
ncbi:MAG: hypothetical protein AAGJ97_04780 [Planctomycetota bacterium]